MEVFGGPGGSIASSVAGRSFDELGFLRGFSFLLPSQEPPDASSTGECASERAALYSINLQVTAAAAAGPGVFGQARSFAA